MTVCELMFVASGTFAFAGFVALLWAHSDAPRSRVAETSTEDPRR